MNAQEQKQGEAVVQSEKSNDNGFKTSAEILKMFREHEIDGKDLVRLDAKKLALMGMTNPLQQLMMLTRIQKHQQLYG